MSQIKQLVLVVHEVHPSIAELQVLQTVAEEA
jgi:hypothetical protein